MTESQLNVTEQAYQMLMAAFTQSSQAVDTMYVPLVKRFKKLETCAKHFNDSFMVKQEQECLKALEFHRSMLVFALPFIEDEKVLEIGNKMYDAFDLIFAGNREGYKVFSALAQDMITEDNNVIPEYVLESAQGE